MAKQPDLVLPPPPQEIASNVPAIAPGADQLGQAFDSVIDSGVSHEQDMNAAFDSILNQDQPAQPVAQAPQVVPDAPVQQAAPAVVPAAPAAAVPPLQASASKTVKQKLAANQAAHPMDKTAPKKGGFALPPEFVAAANAVQQAIAPLGGTVHDALRDAYHGAQTLPVVGPALTETKHTGGEAINDFGHKPLEATASALASLPGGLLGIGDDLANVILKAAHQPTNPTGAREQYYNLPGIKELTQGHEGGKAVGELAGFLGGAPIEAAATGAVKGAVKKGLEKAAVNYVKKPVIAAGAKAILSAPVKPGVKAAIHGTAAGQAYGTLGAAGQDAKEGHSFHLGRSLQQGASTALVGGALGAGLHTVFNAKLPSSKIVKADTATPKAVEKVAGKLMDHSVILKDGSKVSAEDAGALLADPAVPESYKTEIMEQLHKHDQLLAGTYNKSTPENLPVEHDHATIDDDKLVELAKHSDKKVAQAAVDEIGKRAEAEPIEEFEPARAPAHTGETVKAEGREATVIEPPAFGKTKVRFESGEEARLPQSAIEKVESLPKIEPPKIEEDLGTSEEPAQELTPQKVAETKPKFEAVKSEKPGGYHDVINLETGEVHSSSKRSLSQAQAVADKLNAGEIKPTAGHKDSYSVGREPSENRSAIASHGVDVPADASPELQSGLKTLADDTHAYHDARAKFEAAHDALMELTGTEPETSTKPAHQYLQDVEEAAVRHAQETNDPSVLQTEVQNLGKPTGKFSFKAGTSVKAAAEKVLDLAAKADQLKKQYEKSRGAVDGEFRAGVANGTLPNSINVPHKNGAINVRSIPSKKAGATFNDPYKGAPNETIIKRALKNVSRFITEEHGSAPADLPFTFVSDAAKTVDSIFKDDKGTKTFIGDKADMLTGIFAVRRTFDILKNKSAGAYNVVREGITREVEFAKDIHLSPDDHLLVSESESMSPEQIYKGENGLDKLTFAQRRYLAVRNQVRARSAIAVQGILDSMVDEYGAENKMPHAIRTDYQAMELLHDQLSGKPQAGTDTAGTDFIRGLSQLTYDSIFKYNLAYHGLNLLDPLVVGASRVGLNRILIAKAMIQSDKGVKDFIHGYELKTPIQELRAETRANADSNLAQGPLDKLARGAAGLSEKLPDIPSERWNYQDSIAAGIIHHGDMIKYEGGGTQLLKDMAAGTVDPQLRIQAMTEALQVANDVNGVGALGLDKSFLQRNPSMRYFVQFASQPYRVAKLVSDWGTTIAKGSMPEKISAAKSLATFSAMSVMVGGRAVLPKEFDLLEHFDQTRAIYWAVQDLLDEGNITAKVIGRDLTDKMRQSAFPALGGAQTNIVLSSLNQWAEQFRGHKWDDMARGSVVQLVSALVGGGTEINKTIKGAEHAAEGDKKIGFYPSSFIGEAGGRPVGGTTFKELNDGREYNIGDALAENLPGIPSNQGQAQKQARRDFISKQAAKLAQ